MNRVSRPGCRVYVRRTEIPRVLGGMGINILTTPRGVMTGRQARKQGLGGEFSAKFGKTLLATSSALLELASGTLRRNVSRACSRSRDES